MAVLAEKPREPANRIEGKIQRGRGESRRGSLCEFISLSLYVPRLVSPRETIFIPPREFIIYNSQIPRPTPPLSPLSLSLSIKTFAQRNRQAGNFDVNEPFLRFSSHPEVTV